MFVWPAIGCTKSAEIPAEELRQRQQVMIVTLFFRFPQRSKTVGLEQ